MTTQSPMQETLHVFPMQKEGGEARLNHHKKAAPFFIETCYWHAKITPNNNPPPWMPIKRQQQTLGLPTKLFEATVVVLNDTW